MSPCLSRALLTPAQYGLTFYQQYLAKWPEYFLFAEGPGGACQGYSARCPHAQS